MCAAVDGGGRARSGKDKARSGAGDRGGARREHRPPRAPRGAAAPGPSPPCGSAMSAFAAHDGEICLRRPARVEGSPVCVLAGK